MTPIAAFRGQRSRRFEDSFDGEQRTSHPGVDKLFEDATPDAASVAVRLDQIRLERSGRFGDVWLGCTP